MSADISYTNDPFFGALSPFGLFCQAIDYWIDTCQRETIYLDTLRKRGNNHIEQMKSTVPNVLFFNYEIVLDGRELVEPANYMLLRILPNNGFSIDPKKRPFIIFDPRGGHGLGISGMKEESAIGNALRSGHPCYLVGFIPTPVPGQTIEAACKAEALFISKVIEMHPSADKPCLIGNCQAGWQISMVAAMKPDVVGALVLAATPLSFWTGIKGKNPMRYTGGLYGGAWATAFASDLGSGVFDGAMLVQGFESANPAYSVWNKHYNLYAKIDTEPQRFLDFERWWSLPALFNKNEMNFIVEKLFVENSLSLGKVCASDGRRVDLRNIKAPIVIMCSQADEITPPQQALGWILDVYRKDADIVDNKQTIVYSLHKNIGHLSILVSSSVATNGHNKLMSSLDAISSLPHGLYEAVLTEKDSREGKTASDFILKFEPRKIDDIRALGFNGAEDDRMFETAENISKKLHEIYDAFLSPFIRSLSTEETAQIARYFHPVRSRYWALSDYNPFLTLLKPWAEAAKKHRMPAPEDNVFQMAQDIFAKHISYNLDMQKKLRDALAESIFISMYGNPFVQAIFGPNKND